MSGRSVLLVCGSLQATSANRRALDVIAERLAELGAIVEDSIALGGVPAFDPGRTSSPVADALRHQIADSVAVVVATPEYAGGMAGLLKNALDWIVGSGELYGKPAAVVSAGTSGGEHARRDLVRTLTWQGAHVVDELAIAAPRTKTDDAGRYTERATVAALRRVADVVLAAPDLDGADRLRLVREVTARLGIGPEHIAPLI